MIKSIWIIGLLLLSLQVQAAIEVYQFDYPEQEKLYKQMTDELRCLVCQNQNLSASNAALARDLRQQTYQMIMNGKSHDDIVSYMTQRYGDFVLYRPPFKSITVLLWFGPLVLLLLGVWLLIRSLNKNNKSTEHILSKDQYLQMKNLLEKGDN